MIVSNEELEKQRDHFVDELLSKPLNTELYIATFTKISPHKGNVIFVDKHTQEKSYGFYSVVIKDNEVVASLFDKENNLMVQDSFKLFKRSISEKVITW